MSRKFSCIFLAISMVLSSMVLVYADDTEFLNTKEYEAAVETLSESGITPSAEAAFEDGMAVADETGLLRQRSTVPLSQLSAQAVAARQEAQRAEEEAAYEAAHRSAILAQYSGVMVGESGHSLLESPSEDASPVRSMGKGKVGRLRDVEGDWYLVSYGGSTGYLPAAVCSGVSYSDYEGTAATQTTFDQMKEIAYSYLGTPYWYGGTGHSGIDCSGFTMRVFGELGYSLSHGATEQYAAGTPVTPVQREAGDLVFFSSYPGGPIGHVGIYLGGGAFIHASSSSGVIISYLGESYYSARYYGAVRIISE